QLERYVEEFLELANQLSWHDAALGACFQLGVDHETIPCDLPVCEYPLIELINLVLYLKGSNFEVEEIKEDYKSRHPAPSGTRHVTPAHSSLGTPTCRTNGSDHLPSPKHPCILQSSNDVSNPEPPPVALTRPPAILESSPPAALRSSPPALPMASQSYIVDIMDMALPLEFTATILSLTPPESSTPPVPAPPERPPRPWGGHIPVAIVVGPKVKATEAVQPWPPELSAPPWLPELPDPPWPPELSAPPWLPKLPDLPWPPQLSAPPWPPELPDPPWSVFLFRFPCSPASCFCSSSVTMVFE
ncbi:hypothetical protein M9458_029873, partial [Cirrhinus mrigala]